MTASPHHGGPGGPDWVLRDIDSPAELAAVEALQRLIWSGGDADVVPGHVLLTAAHNGGLVAGAFVEGRLAGFVWGFLGMDTGADRPRLKHCSHQLGVHPDYRNTGLGFALKCFQRERVLSQGLDRITWTYDPLLARNARLNIGKLGATCSTYLRDLYGEMHDALNAGLPSDRFQVDWWIRSEPVAARLGGKTGPRPSLTALLARGAVLLNPPSPPDPLPPPDSTFAGCRPGPPCWSRYLPTSRRSRRPIPPWRCAGGWRRDRSSRRCSVEALR